MGSNTDPEFEKLVNLELNNLLVRAEAKRKFEETALTNFTMPRGTFASDPLPLSPPELIPGLLLAHGATGLIGMKETGKTLSALEMQHSLLTGKPLWDVITPNITIKKSVHFYAEHSCRTILEQYKLMQLPETDRQVFYGPEDLKQYKVLVSGGVCREHAVSVYKHLAEGAGLVVFDPIAAFIQGEGAENDNIQMRLLVDTMIDIARETGAGCLVLGHQGKPTLIHGELRSRDSYATRGASSIEDALTAVLYLNAKSEPVGDRDVYEIVQRRFKGRKIKPFQLLRDRDTLRQTMAIAALRRK